jgi:hypothetical protein
MSYQTTANGFLWHCQHVIAALREDLVQYRNDEDARIIRQFKREIANLEGAVTRTRGAGKKLAANKSFSGS